MDFDAAKSKLLHCLTDHRAHEAAVALGVNEGESEEAIRLTRDDPGYLTIRNRIVGMKRGEENGMRDTSLTRSGDVSLERRDVSQGPVSPSPLPAWQWQSMIMPRSYLPNFRIASIVKAALTSSRIPSTP